MGWRFGASDTIIADVEVPVGPAVAGGARCPALNESSTVEWHNAQVMPMDRSPPRSSKKPFTPTTASSLSRATVVAGSSRSTAPCLICRDQRRRERLAVDLQADGQRGLGADAVADAAVLRARDGAVELKRIAPERLAAEGVEAEGLPAFLEHPAGMLLGDVRRAGCGSARGTHLRSATPTSRHDHQDGQACCEHRPRPRDGFHLDPSSGPAGQATGVDAPIDSSTFDLGGWCSGGIVEAIKYLYK